MNVVLIKHNTEQSKKYCFAVPDHLLPHVKMGVNVICDTRRGNMPGVVVSDVMSGDEADQEIERMLMECGARMPLKYISAVVETIDISDVRVPIWMEMSTPHKSKLDRRKRELQEFGYFHTNVCIEDGILKDGYTAFLVCKNKGMKMLPVAVLAR